MALRSKKIAIDLGSTTTRIYVPKKGLVLEKPTLLARDEAIEEIVALGPEAIDIAGRSPDTITVLRPLSSGVIADYGAATTLLKHYIQEATGRFQLNKPEAMITVSGSATSTEQRALIDAGREAGLANVYLIRSSVAAALGAGLPITEARGNFIVNIGSGTTEIGVFSLGGVVAHEAVRVGGQAIDDAITRFMRREHSMQLGTDEIRRIKHEFLSMGDETSATITVHGRNILQGLPKSATIKLSHLRPYVETALERIVIAIRRVLEQTPPDLISDVIKHGIVLSGGGAQVDELPAYLAKRLRVAFVVADEPMTASIQGAHIALTHLEDYKRSLLT